MDNSSQQVFWNGPGGSAWVAAQEQLDGRLQPLSDAALIAAAAAPGEQVLDVGCGCGDTTLQLARTATRVLGVDISAPMLQRAAGRARGQAENAEFLLADAAQHPFEANFDLLFSRFGVMFFADPCAAFANLRQALKPGGRLCFICWQPAKDNPWLAIAARAAQPFMAEAEAPDPRAPGPFAFADPHYVTQVLVEAGFADVRTTPVTAAIAMGQTVDDAIRFLTEVGPLRRVLDELDGTTRDAALAAARAALADYENPAGLAMGAACWIVTANRD